MTCCKGGHFSCLFQSHDPDFHVVQYADDTIMLLLANRSQLRALKEALLLFSQSTGLKISFHKSSMIPINVDSSKASELANLIGFKMGSMPFTYFRSKCYYSVNRPTVIYLPYRLPAFKRDTSSEPMAPGSILH